MFVFIYLNGDSVDPIALHAQLKGIDADEPIGTRIDPRHDAYQRVINVQECTSGACALALRHWRPRERVQQAVGRLAAAAAVEAVRSARFHVLPGAARQSLAQPIQRVRGVVRSS